MILPEQPLPGPGILLRGSTAQSSHGTAWLTGPGEQFVNFYRQGRDALSAIVHECQKICGEKLLEVWLPAYFCDEALTHLRGQGQILKFYDLKPDLTPDWMALESEFGKNRRKRIFLHVYYFGFVQAVEEALDFCRRHSAFFIEDATHLLRPSGGVGQGDFIFFSPRKILPIPMGALAVTRRAFNEKSAVSKSVSLNTWRWIVKRLTQRALTEMRLPWHYLWNNASIKPIKFNDKEIAVVLDQEGPWTVERYSLSLLGIYEENFSLIEKKRRLNYERLLRRIVSISGIEPLLGPLGPQDCPYVFAFRQVLGTQRDCSSLVQLLRKAAIAAYRWPDLPSEVWNNKQNYPVSSGLFDQVFLLPIHQDLSELQIDYMAQELARAMDLLR